MESQKIDIEKISQLAMLKLTLEEKLRFSSQLEEVLSYIDKLNELNTDNVNPMRHVIELETAFREDIIGPSLDRRKALMNAPAQEDGFFKTPKVKD